MRRILTVLAVFAALFLMSCGATAEEKNQMKAQAKKITDLENKVGELQKTVTEQKAKAETPQTPAPAPQPRTPQPTPPTKTK